MKKLIIWGLFIGAISLAITVSTTVIAFQEVERYQVKYGR